MHCRPASPHATDERKILVLLLEKCKASITSPTHLTIIIVFALQPHGHGCSHWGRRGTGSWAGHHGDSSDGDRTSDRRYWPHLHNRLALVSRPTSIKTQY